MLKTPGGEPVKNGEFGSWLQPISSDGTMPWPVAGYTVFSFTTLDADAEAKTYAELVPPQQSWAGWALAVQGLQEGLTPTTAYTKAMDVASAQVEQATEAVAAKLCLHATDAPGCEPDPDLQQVAPPQQEAQPAAGGGGPAATPLTALELRRWRVVGGVKLKQLRGEDGRLRAMGVLCSALGSHITLASRQARTFKRGVKLFYDAAARKAGEPATITSAQVTQADEELADEDELSEHVASILRAMCVEKELLRAVPQPAAAEVTTRMREYAAAWQTGAHLTSQFKAQMLVNSLEGALAIHPGVAALVYGGRAADRLPEGASAVHAALAALSTRIGVRGADVAFCPAALADLNAKVVHLAPALEAAPWSTVSMRARCDHVIELVAETDRRSQRGSFEALQAPERHKSEDVAKGVGTVPRHFQHLVPGVKASAPYRSLRVAVLRRQAAGGRGSSVDQLLILATGIVDAVPSLDGEGAGGETPATPQRQWCALAHLYAAGDDKGVKPALIDESLAHMSAISEESWASLLGRTAASAVCGGLDSVPKTGLASCLTLSELLAAMTGKDWTKLDLGQAAQAATLALDDKPAPRCDDSPLRTKENLEYAQQVAEPILQLFGFHGGSHVPWTLPNCLVKVLATYKHYGVEGARGRRVVTEGVRLLRRTLRSLGRRRWQFLADKRPDAPALDPTAPHSARDAWDRHMKCLAGARSLEGYHAYTRDGDDRNDDNDSVCSDGAGGPATTPKKQRSAGPSTPGKGASTSATTPNTTATGAAGAVAKVSIKDGVAVLTKGAYTSPSLTVAAIQKSAASGAKVCVPGFIANAYRTICQLTAEDVAHLCSKHELSAPCHRLKPGCGLAACYTNKRLREKGLERFEAKKRRKAGKGADKSADGADGDDGDDGNDDDGSGGGGRPAADDADADAEGAASAAGDGKPSGGPKKPKKPKSPKKSGKPKGGKKAVHWAATVAAHSSEQQDQGEAAAELAAGQHGPRAARQQFAAAGQLQRISDASRQLGAGERVQQPQRPRVVTTAARAGARKTAPAAAMAAAGLRSSAPQGSRAAGDVYGPALQAGTFTVPAMLAAYITSHGGRVLTTIGDRRGRVRDARVAGGELAVSVDTWPSESKALGMHLLHDAEGLVLPLHDASVQFWPCEQQSFSLGLEVAAIKAADGRMFHGLRRWVAGFCINARCVISEQPDSYVRDFYDPKLIMTDPTEWGGEWQKLTMLAYRGCDAPVPPRARSEGDTAWHRRRGGDGAAVARARDETCEGMARGLAAQAVPSGGGEVLDCDLEVERLAVAWHQAGLPVPDKYWKARGGLDTAAQREYADTRGRGDGRRVQGVVPRSLRDDGSWRSAKVVAPAVSARGLTLARKYRELVQHESAAQATGEDEAAGLPKLQLGSLSGHAIAVVPARYEAGRMMVLLPAGESGDVIGELHPQGHGERSEDRKAVAEAAGEIVARCFPPGGPRVDYGLAGHLKMAGHIVSIIAAWVPMICAIALLVGCVWQRAAAVQGAARPVCESVAHRGLRWRRPQFELSSGLSEGALPPAPVTDGQWGGGPIDSRAAAARVARDLRKLRELLEARAAQEAHIAPQLREWAAKTYEGDAFAPPPELEALAVQPNAQEVLRMPFTRRCTIPTTEPFEPRPPAQEWPAGVPRPTTAIASYRPEYRSAIRKQLRRLVRWNAAMTQLEARKRAAAGTALEAAVAAEPRPPRPKSRAWSDAARPPWLQRRVLRFQGGRCTLLNKPGPAIPSRLGAARAALLWQMRWLPHRRLLSHCVHGVRMSDTLPLHTRLSPNLYSLYEVRGGPDAVANEVGVLKARGFYSTTTGGDGTESGGGELPELQASPLIDGPRGMVERKALDGPPRGVAEMGDNRKPMWTSDAAEEPCDSINNSSGEREGLGGPDLVAWPLPEVKPRLEDAALAICIIWCIAQTLGVAVLVLLFDYKYFFHALVWEYCEIWKTGCAVPARAAEGGADHRLMDALLELVMAMGWTRASGIAQDLANALVWRLAQLVDVELRQYVREQRAARPAFNAAWVRRCRIPHKPKVYGSHARLVESLQYTDDEISACAGPVATEAKLVCFCRLIGPTLYLGRSAGDSARGTAVRYAAHRRGDAIPASPRPARGSIVLLQDDQPAPQGAMLVELARVSPGGNPFLGSAGEVVKAYACLLASRRVEGVVADIAQLRGLEAHAAQARCSEASLDQWLDEVHARLSGGGGVAFRLGSGAAKGESHHVTIIVKHLEQRARHEDALECRPEDPVRAAPVPAQGLDLEAAKPAKWHVGGAAVWIGAGLSAALLVSWVPQHKATTLLLAIADALAGICKVQRYKSLVHSLQDLNKMVGGKGYRMTGLFKPLQRGAEIDSGPDTLVRPRRHMSARLRAWQDVLANTPGASLLAALAPSRIQKGLWVVWEIGGDAASESLTVEGLGAFFYGVWWAVPLVAIAGMAGLHITCLELIELGLGVVIVGPWIARARHKRLVSDALVAVATLRARMPDGRRAKGAQARALIAVHEVMLKRPEWQHVKGAEVAQAYGETMLLHDAASRGYTETISSVCSAIGVTPTKLDPLPTRATEYLHDAVAAARNAMQEESEEDSMVEAQERPAQRAASASGAGGVGGARLARALSLAPLAQATCGNAAAVPLPAGLDRLVYLEATRAVPAWAVSPAWALLALLLVAVAAFAMVRWTRTRASSGFLWLPGDDGPEEAMDSDPPPPERDALDRMRWADPPDIEAGEEAEADFAAELAASALGRAGGAARQAERRRMAARQERHETRWECEDSANRDAAEAECGQVTMESTVELLAASGATGVLQPGDRDFAAVDVMEEAYQSGLVAHLEDSVGATYLAGDAAEREARLRVLGRTVTAVLVQGRARQTVRQALAIEECHGEYAGRMVMLQLIDDPSGGGGVSVPPSPPKSPPEASGSSSGTSYVPPPAPPAPQPQPPAKRPRPPSRDDAPLGDAGGHAAPAAQGAVEPSWFDLEVLGLSRWVHAPAHPVSRDVTVLSELAVLAREAIDATSSARTDMVEHDVWHQSLEWRRRHWGKGLRRLTPSARLPPGQRWPCMVHAPLLCLQLGMRERLESQRRMQHALGMPGLETADDDFLHDLYEEHSDAASVLTGAMFKRAWAWVALALAWARRLKYLALSADDVHSLAPLTATMGGELGGWTEARFMAQDESMRRNGLWHAQRTVRRFLQPGQGAATAETAIAIYGHRGADLFSALSAALRRQRLQRARRAIRALALCWSGMYELYLEKHFAWGNSGAAAAAQHYHSTLGSGDHEAATTPTEEPTQAVQPVPREEWVRRLVGVMMAASLPEVALAKRSGDAVQSPGGAHGAASVALLVGIALAAAAVVAVWAAAMLAGRRRRCGSRRLSDPAQGAEGALQVAITVASLPPSPPEGHATPSRQDGESGRETDDDERRSWFCYCPGGGMGRLRPSLQDWMSFLGTPFRLGIPALQCDAPYTSEVSVHEELQDSWGFHVRHAGQMADDAEWQRLVDERTRDADSQEGRLLAEWREAEVELRLRRRAAAAEGAEAERLAEIDLDIAWAQRGLATAEEHYAERLASGTLTPPPSPPGQDSPSPEATASIARLVDSLAECPAWTNEGRIERVFPGTAVMQELKGAVRCSHHDLRKRTVRRAALRRARSRGTGYQDAVAAFLAGQVPAMAEATIFSLGCEFEGVRAAAGMTHDEAHDSQCSAGEAMRELKRVIGRRAWAWWCLCRAWHAMITLEVPITQALLEAWWRWGCELGGFAEAKMLAQHQGCRGLALAQQYRRWGSAGECKLFVEEWGVDALLAVAARLKVRRYALALREMQLDGRCRMLAQRWYDELRLRPEGSGAAAALQQCRTAAALQRHEGCRALDDWIAALTPPPSPPQNDPLGDILGAVATPPPELASPADSGESGVAAHLDDLVRHLRADPVKLETAPEWCDVFDGAAPREESVDASTLSPAAALVLERESAGALRATARLDRRLQESVGSPTVKRSAAVAKLDHHHPEVAELVDGHGARSSALVTVQARKVTQPAQPIRHATEAALKRGTSVRAEPVDDPLAESRQALLERSMQSLRRNDDGLGVRGECDELMRGLLSAARLAFEKRFARATVRQDKSYWKFWVAFCERIGTPPLRINAAANSGVNTVLHEREVAIALGAFMTWVGENPQFRVDSMLARLRGVARRHVQLGATFVSLKTVALAAAGLVQEHIDVHGAEALQPKSKEPLTAEEINAMLSLTPGMVVDGKIVGDNLDWQGVKTWICLFCTGGFRKEAVGIGDDEEFGTRKLSCYHITWRLRGRLVRHPTPQQLALITVGDGCYVSPCPCKNDPENKKFGNSPVPSDYHPTRLICLARELAKYMVMRAVPPDRAKLEPLIVAPGGKSYSKRGLDKLFHALIARVVIDPARRKTLSVHSFRVWLACALLAAGATPEQILHMLRWSSEAARRLYARMGDRIQTALLTSAIDVPLDTIRSRTLRIGDEEQTQTEGEPSAATSADSADAAAATAALHEAQHLLAAAAERSGELPRPDFDIDDDADHARLHEAADRLMRTAEAADAANAAESAGESSDDGGY